MYQDKIKKIINLIFVVCVVSLPFVMISCTKEKREPDPSAASFSPTGPATLSTIQSDVFLLGCAVSGCHDNRSNPAGGLSMIDAEASFNGMVNIASTQHPSLKMVVPGDADNSYLVHKLQGTHLAIGGTGQQMPQFAAALPQGQIDRVVQWILDGAQKN